MTQLDAAGRAIDVYYDDDNQVIATNTAGQEMSRNEYDARGDLTKRTLPAGRGPGRPALRGVDVRRRQPRHLVHTDVFGKTTDIHVQRGRPADEDRIPDGTSTSLTYTSLGRVASSTDQLQRKSLFVQLDRRPDQTDHPRPGR